MLPVCNDGYSSGIGFGFGNKLFQFMFHESLSPFPPVIISTRALLDVTRLCSASCLQAHCSVLSAFQLLFWPSPNRVACKIWDLWRKANLHSSQLSDSLVLSSFLFPVGTLPVLSARLLKGLPPENIAPSKPTPQWKSFLNTLGGSNSR